MLSKWRPDVDIVGLTPNDRVLRQMQILWGVRPVKAQWQLSTEQLAQNAVNTAKERGYVTSGDTVVMTTGVDQQCARRASARGRIYEHDACASD